MKNMFTSLLVCIILGSCSKKTESNPDKFIRFVNNYAVDSLDSILSDKFEIKRTFVKYENDKSSFLNSYMKTLKENGGHISIQRKETTGDTSRYVVKTGSYFFTYLHIEPPTMIYTFVCDQQQKITTIFIDTSGSFHKYQEEISKEMDLFKAWLQLHHPGESDTDLVKTQGLLESCLKAYSEKDVH